MPPAPSVVRAAGLLVVAQGVAGLVVAAILMVRGVGGADQSVVNGLGTAIWFVVVGSGVFAAGWALMTGRRWGRGLAIFAQLMLLPVAWYVAVGSHQLLFGIPVGIMALCALGLLFSPGALRWAAGGDQPGPANAASGGPESR
nr:hypothetical protein [Mycobacterium spongiae]